MVRVTLTLDELKMLTDVFGGGSEFAEGSQNELAGWEVDEQRLARTIKEKLDAALIRGTN